MRNQIDWATNYMGTLVTSKELDASGNIIADDDNTTVAAGRLW
jgi:hypothetical protein